MNKIVKTLSCVVLTGLIAVPFAIAQDSPERGDREEAGDRGEDRGDRGERGERGEDRGDRARGGFDPARMREMMVERIKEQLAPTDEEWGVIKPKLEKVMETRFQQLVGGFGGFGRRGGPDGEEREPRNDMERASRDLRRTLDDTGAAPETIASKLQAVRDARAKAQAEVKAAQEDLQSVLTPRQEAVLVVNGMLE